LADSWQLLDDYAGGGSADTTTYIAFSGTTSSSAQYNWISFDTVFPEDFAGTETGSQYQMVLHRRCLSYSNDVTGYYFGLVFPGSQADDSARTLSPVVTWPASFSALNSDWEEYIYGNPFNTDSTMNGYTEEEWRSCKILLGARRQVSMGDDGSSTQFSAVKIRLLNYKLKVVGPTVTPTTGALRVTGNTPTWEAVDTIFEPATGSIVVAGNTPQVFPVLPQTGAINVTGGVPIHTGGSVFAVPMTGDLQATGNVPVFSAPISPVYSAPLMVADWIGQPTGGEYGHFYCWVHWNPEQTYFQADRMYSIRMQSGQYSNTRYIYTLDAHYADNYTNGGSPTAFFTVSDLGYRETAFEGEGSVPPGWQLNNRDGSGTYAGSTGICHYSSYNGGRVGQYACLSVIGHVTTSSATDMEWHHTVVKNGLLEDTNYQVEVGPVPWYDANGDPENWVGNFYGRDVHNDVGYLLGLKVVGADTVPAIYKWTGNATWDAGTAILVSADESVDFVTKIIGWCRADPANRDRYYAVVTTETIAGAFLKFKVIAVDLTNIAGYTILINENTIHGKGTWQLSGEGTGKAYSNNITPQGVYRQGTTSAEERCVPLTRGGNNYFLFRTNSIADVKGYTKFQMNANWLTAPALTHIPANLQVTLPSMPTSNHDMHNHLQHAVIYNPDTDKLIAGVISHDFWWDEFTSTREPGGTQGEDTKLYFHWSWRDLDDPTGSFTPYEYIFRVGAYLSNYWGGGSLYTRNWGVNPQTGDPFGVMGYAGAIGPSFGDFAQVSFLIRPQAARLEYNNPDVALNLTMDMYHDTIPFIACGARLAIKIFPNMNLSTSMVGSCATQLGSSYTFTGRYELEAAGELVPLSLDMNLEPLITVTLPTDGLIELLLDMNLDVDSFNITIAEEVHQTVVRFFPTYWVSTAQSWSDDLRALVNIRRAGLGLELYDDILLVSNGRLLYNQKGFDAIQLHAKDMRANNLLDVNNVLYTDGYETITDRCYIQMNVSFGIQTAVTAALIGASENGRIISDDTMPSANYLWTTGGWETLLAALWDYDYGVGKTELYLQLGIDFGPRTGYADVNRIYFSFAGTDYTSKVYEQYGGGGGPPGGGGGSVVTTPYTNTKTFRADYVLMGHEYVEAIIDAINVYRADNGLPGFPYPDFAFYQKYDKKIAERHSQNVLDTQVVNHESLSFPVGWQYFFADRLPYAGYGSQSSEIIAIGNADPVYDPANPGVYAIQQSILNQYTIMEPEAIAEAFYLSPPHRAAMLYDWQGGDPKWPEVGTRWEKFPANTLFSDTYHGVAFYVTGWYQVTTIVIAQAGIGMATKYFNGTWTLNGAFINQLTADWDLLCYTNATQQHTAPYSIKVGRQHDAPYTSRVGAAHVAPLHYSVTFQHEAPYHALVPALAQHESPYRIRNTVDVVRQHEALYGQNTFAWHEAPYDVSVVVMASHEAPWGQGVIVKAYHEGVYGVQAAVAAQHSAEWFNTTPVKRQHEARWDITTVNPVRAQNVAFYSLLGGSTVKMGGGVTLIAQGHSIELEDLVVNQSEDDPAWHCRARIPDVADYILLTRGMPVVVSLQGETWNLIVNSTSLSRDANGLDMQVTLESSIVNLMQPIAEVSDYTSAVSINAKALVEQILGQAVDWDILDWSIPAGRFVVNGSTPYEAAAVVAQAAGGIIQAKKDGTLRVRYRYPVGMNQLANFPPDQILTDEVDNLSADVSYEYRTGYNRFRITEASSTFNDRLDWQPEETDPTKGYLRAFLSPWRATYDLIYTDSDGPVSKSFRGTFTEELTEVVSFTSGSGGVRYPIDSLVSVAWLSDPLGTPTFDLQSTSLTTGVSVHEGYGLAEITYVTKFQGYYLTGILGNQAQFIIQNEE